jgi:hypothetical protein
MTWCEQNRVDFVFGMARNKRLEGLIAGGLAQAQQQFESTRQPARVFAEFEHETLSGSWSRTRRVVAKAEHIDGKSNPRFIVTSLAAQSWEKRDLYEQLYCARGDMENHQEAVRAVCRSRKRVHHASQSTSHLSVRHGLHAPQRPAPVGPAGNGLGYGSGGHHPMRLLKIGALVRVTVRKVWVRMASSYPYQALFAEVLRQLRT